MSEEELQREIVSGAFSMQVADCERNIRIQFERLQQENQELKEMFEDSKTFSKQFLYKHNKNLLEANEKLQQQLDKYKDVIEEVREIINKMLFNGYVKGGTIYMATTEDSEFGTRAKFLLQILDKAKVGDKNE